MNADPGATVGGEVTEKCTESILPDGTSGFPRLRDGAVPLGSESVGNAGGRVRPDEDSPRAKRFLRRFNQDIFALPPLESERFSISIKSLRLFAITLLPGSSSAAFRR